VHPTPLFLQFLAFAQAPPSVIWRKFQWAATRLSFNIFQHLYALNILQITLLAPKSKIVLDSDEVANTIGASLKQVLEEAMEPRHNASTGATRLSSVYELAAVTEGVPVLLMARCIQAVILDKLPPVGPVQS
jgi:hypothetical protein